jgi:hypothetical protein
MASGVSWLEGILFAFFAAFLCGLAYVAYQVWTQPRVTLRPADAWLRKDNTITVYGCEVSLDRRMVLANSVATLRSLTRSDGTRVFPTTRQIALWAAHPTTTQATSARRT